MQNEDKPGAGSSSIPPSGNARDEVRREFANSGAAGGPTYEDDKPLIQWQEGDLPRIVDEAEAALMRATDLHLYQRGPLLVRVVRRQAMSVRNFKRPAGSLGIVPVDRNYLIESLTRAAHWERFDKRANAWKRSNAPEQVAATYMSRGGHWKLPLLLATISAPTLRPDGSLLQIPGYDQDMATWYDPCGLEFPRIPDRPTRADAEAALAMLRDVFAEFPFVDALDESVFLTFVLTALVRRSLDAAPLGAFTAPDMQSGKTLLADCISLVSTGVTTTIMRYPDNDEEAAKAALAILSEGEAVVLVDNIERPLQGDWLCVILTSEKYSGRLLGRTEMLEVPTSTLWLATGNHLVVQGDLRTRALLCRIDAKMENPGARSFRHDLKDWIPRHRPELVAAGLTIMRAWAVSGNDEGELVPPWSRFAKWSAMCRAPLVWLGLPDPYDSLKLLEQDDPKRIQLVQLLAGWWKRYGESPMTAGEVCSNAVAGDDEWQEALRGIAHERGEWKPKKLAAYLRHNAGRRIGYEDDQVMSTRWFEKAGETAHTKVMQWKVANVTGR